ncbi:MAG TPA: cystathionine gamma-synthase [Chloroflexota bacterium]|nr:cystathionine gamma-synthase [Chloroflexota bacterium]
MSDYGFSTRAIHVGQPPDPATGAVITPIYQTSTFAQEAPGKHKGYEYSRSGNPTRAALEECLASLEGGRHGLAFASGLGAETTILHTLRSGDHVVAMDDLYGGTFRLFERVFRPLGITFSYVDARDQAALQSALTPATRLVWLESPTNPLLKVVDIKAVAALAHQAGAKVVVDNTFLSPYLQQPLVLGADVVVHSATKYLGGHSDVVGGAIILQDDELAAQLRFLQNATGPVPGPMDCFLILRGIKTLAVRMEAHERNAGLVARMLAEHPSVERVYYPGLPTHPDHEVASRQQRGFGGMVTFVVGSSLERATAVLRRLRLFTLAESLGGVESLAEHPASMTHASIPPDRRAELGVSEGLIRLSVGIEDGDDLLADLRQALEG